MAAFFVNRNTQTTIGRVPRAVSPPSSSPETGAERGAKNCTIGQGCAPESAPNSYRIRAEGRTQRKTPRTCVRGVLFGGAKRDRTADLNTASVALSQLS